MLRNHQGEVFAHIYVANPHGSLCVNIGYGLYGSFWKKMTKMNGKCLGEERICMSIESCL